MKRYSFRRIASSIATGEYDALREEAVAARDAGHEVVVELEADEDRRKALWTLNSSKVLFPYTSVQVLEEGESSGTEAEEGFAGQDGDDGEGASPGVFEGGGSADGGGEEEEGLLL